jgi:hypothetical protein
MGLNLMNGSRRVQVMEHARRSTAVELRRLRADGVTLPGRSRRRRGIGRGPAGPKHAGASRRVAGRPAAPTGRSDRERGQTPPRAAHLSSAGAPGDWCIGNTAVSKTATRGSTPRSPAPMPQTVRGLRSSSGAS